MTFQRRKKQKRLDVGYEPLPSVWEGDDSDLLDKMLRFYPREDPEWILDATVNKGRFWRGSDRDVVGLDIDAQFKPTVVADNAEMPFRDDFFDVVVYDPPHIPNQGKDRTKDFSSRFGLVLKSAKENGYNNAHLYPRFVEEAFRVLRPEGILFCKIADYIHNHRHQGRIWNSSMPPRRSGFVRAIALSRSGKARLPPLSGSKPTMPAANIAIGWCFENRTGASES